MTETSEPSGDLLSRDQNGTRSAFGDNQLTQKLAEHFGFINT